MRYDIDSFCILKWRIKGMPITELLEANAKKYPNEVSPVEINPDIQEKRREHLMTTLWKSYSALMRPLSRISIS